MKIDLHCHTEASIDCITPLAAIPSRCRQQEIRVQAITDHDEVWGAQELQKMVAAQKATEPPLSIIVGEEVSTLEGEIIGLFLKEKVPPGLSAVETVARIKQQDGLVLLPHGFDRWKRGRLRPEALVQIANDVDIVETFNARISFSRYNRRAAKWAKDHEVVSSAGTDAHRWADIGVAWAEVPDKPIHHPQDLLHVLENGEVMGEWTHPVIAFIKKMWVQTKYRLRPST